MTAINLFSRDLKVINIGLPSFADAIAGAGGAVQQIEWAPPAQGDRTVGVALARLVNNADVDAGNRRAYAAYLASQPVLEGIGLAKNELPGIGRRMILHAGPPIEWPKMCGPMKGAIVGAILFEGWAEDDRRGEAPGRRRDDPLRTLPPPWRGRADGRRHQPLDAGVDRARRASTAIAPSATSTRGWARRCALARTAAGVRRLDWMARDAAQCARRRAKIRWGRSNSSRSWPRRCRWATRSTTAMRRRPRCC